MELLFDSIAQENKALDKPKQFLEQILDDLESTRKSIFYNYIPDGPIKAVYHFDTICLLPAYLKQVLGPEEKLIRREWQKKGFSTTFIKNGTPVDYTQLKHQGGKFNAVVINSEVLEDLGYDFSDDKA